MCLRYALYISIDERNKIYRTNLIRHPQLATQRDIFVFQCLIGCRVGDLYKLTRDNLIGGAVEYIPRKTKDGHPVLDGAEFSIAEQPNRANTIAAVRYWRDTAWITSLLFQYSL